MNELMVRNIFLSIAYSLILGVPAVGAQTVQITKEQFDRFAEGALANTSTRPRRETTNAKKFQAGRVIEEELTTQDFSPPDKERWLILARSPEKNTRVEVVYIGDIEYRRENKDPWKKIDRADPKNPMTIGPATPTGKVGPTGTYTREEQIVEGMRLQILSERSSGGKSVSGGLRTRRLTLDAYGYILKIEESVSEGSPENVVFTSLTSIVYSSHPIIIEAPIK